MRHSTHGARSEQRRWAAVRLLSFMGTLTSKALRRKRQIGFWSSNTNWYCFLLTFPRLF